MLHSLWKIPPCYLLEWLEERLDRDVSESADSVGRVQGIPYLNSYLFHISRCNAIYNMTMGSHLLYIIENNSTAVKTKHSSKPSILQVKYTLVFKRLVSALTNSVSVVRLDWTGVAEYLKHLLLGTTSGLVLFASLSDLVFELFYLDILGNLTSLCFTFADFISCPQDGCGTQSISNISINMQFTLVHVLYIPVGSFYDSFWTDRSILRLLLNQ